MKQPLELTVMMYHYIRDRDDTAGAGSGIGGLPVSAFEAQLDSLARQHTFVTWDDVRAALQGNGNLPGSACLLTFDDGICDHYLDVFQILRRRNLSGLFFIIDRSREQGLILGHKIHFLLAALGVDALQESIRRRLGPLETTRFLQAEQKYRIKYPSSSLDGRIELLKILLQRDLSMQAGPLLSDLFEQHIGPEIDIARSFYLNSEQIREMSADGMHFGGHGRRHPWFDWIGVEERQSEIEASAQWIRRFEPGPWAFAYPYGGLSNDSPTLLRKHGFLAAFTTQSQVLHTDPFFIGRLDGEG